MSHTTEARVSVVAVVVTWNRRELLRRCLDAVLGQTHAPSRVVVVDNASDDGTEALLAQEYAGRHGDRPPVQVVRTTSNIGGAGGFALGISAAFDGSGDAVWLLDDDTIPTPTALAELVRARTAYELHTGLTPALVASRAVWTDGREHPMNTPRAKPTALAPERAAASRIGCIPIRTASFVSILVDLPRARAVGVPEAAFFLWNDDFDYTARLLRGRRGLYCPASVVVHETRVFGSTDADPGPRFHLEVRNKVWTFTRSRGLTPLDRALYGAATLRRWGRTIARSHDRATLLTGLRDGLREGIGSAPRPTRAVLADALGYAVPQPAVPQPAETPPPVGVRPEGFAVLMPVYGGDQPDALAAAFTSVTTEQTLRPDQLVLVVDGPLPAALGARVEQLVAGSPVPVTLVRLPVNLGLGPALQAGLAASRHDIVARMDADDISLPHRFAVQVPLVQGGLDIVGSALLEFGADPGDVVARRDVVTDPAAIAERMRFRQTLNHPTVVFRASAVHAAGGYLDLPSLEDYLLFARMIQAGARVGNVAEPLLLYRVGEGAYARRGGLGLLRSELALQRRFRAMGFTNAPQSARNVLVRGVYRVVPEGVRRTAYRKVFARDAD